MEGTRELKMVVYLITMGEEYPSIQHDFKTETDFHNAVSAARVLSNDSGSPVTVWVNHCGAMTLKARVNEGRITYTENQPLKARVF